ncbi:unnamed protein product [Phytophthora fragariaefolia]|uniref:Unnamed protein product n=1 Tax=Phytophthora fragariaefolia TaxID=1490495 RepID=A0A9W6U3Z0_9STRA|nr:unnamed protein product [Phytophthora fragariaefolia]
MMLFVAEAFWNYKSKLLFGRASQFAVLLSPWHLVVQRIKEKDCAFTQPLHATVTNFVDLDEALAPVAPPKQGSPTTRLEPSLLYARIPKSHDGFVVSFDGSAKTPKFGGYGSCSWTVWRLPDWKIVIAASAYLETTTVNLAEYTGMNNGVLAALELGADNFIIVGDSRFAIQQSLGVIACRTESLMTILNRHRELTAPISEISSHCAASSGTNHDDSSSLTELSRLVRRRSPKRSAHVPTGQVGLFLDRDTCRCREAREIMSGLHFKQKQTSSARTLTREHTGRAPVPTGVSGLCYTPADNSARELGVVAVSVLFTGFVIAKAMSNTDALRVAQAFEECVYRRFGAPSLIRHDRDPRFMSEVFQAFTEMMQSKSRATLSYRPQANGQQERSVTIVIQSVRVYAEDPLQQDWDEIIERLVFAINTSMDTTRKETASYLVHGWDARSMLRAMTSSLRRGKAKQSDALAWRREVNRQQEITLEMVKKYIMPLRKQDERESTTIL